MKTKNYLTPVLLLTLSCHTLPSYQQPANPITSTRASREHGTSSHIFSRPIAPWKALTACSLGLASYLGNLPQAFAQNDFFALESSLTDALLNHQVIQTSDGDIAQVQSFLHDGDPAFTYGVVTKLTFEGTPIWSRAITSSLPCPNGNVTLNALTESSDNYIVVGGSIVSGTQTNTDILLASFSSDDGVLSAMKRGGQADSNTVCDLDADDSGSVWAVGPFDQGGSTGGANAYITRFQASDLSLLFRRLHNIYSRSCCNMQVMYKKNLRTHVFFKNDQGVSSGVFGMQIFDIQSDTTGATYTIQYSAIAQNQGFSNFCIRGALGTDNGQTTLLVGDSNGKVVLTKFNGLTTSFQWEWLQKMANTFPVELNNLVIPDSATYSLFSGTQLAPNDETFGLLFRMNDAWNIIWAKQFNIQSQEGLQATYAIADELYTYGFTRNDTLIIHTTPDGDVNDPSGFTTDIANSQFNFSNITRNFFQGMTSTSLPEPPLAFNDFSIQPISDFGPLLSLEVLIDTNLPSTAPIPAPSTAPTQAPSNSPTLTPTHKPSNLPLDFPIAAPSAAPSNTPAIPPTAAPSAPPTQAPTNSPAFPTIATPSAQPSLIPSLSPSIGSYNTTEFPLSSTTQPPESSGSQHENDLETAFRITEAGIFLTFGLSYAGLWGTQVAARLFL